MFRRERGTSQGCGDALATVGIAVDVASCLNEPPGKSGNVTRGDAEYDACPFAFSFP